MRRPATDVNAAKKLLADAGYPNGFSVTLHCPNDRYVNDEAICQAAVGMWGAIGVKVNLVSQSKSIHFTLIQKNPAETEFYMVGWGVPTYDSHYIFSFMYHTRGLQPRLVERHWLFQQGCRCEDRLAHERNRSRQAQRDDCRHLEDAEG